MNKIKHGGVQGHYSTWQPIPKGFPYVCMADWKKSINENKKEVKK